MSRTYHGNDLFLGITASGKKLLWTEEMRRLHMYVSGVTGSGKSRCLQSLIRQDLDQHARTRQGMLLLDPHGELYDGTLAYIAANPSLWRLPVVLIDLRKDDWIVAYNLLKERPGIDPAVVATGFVESITHAFGGANPTETPRLARIGRMFIQALFDGKRTLFDLLPMLAHENGALRESLLRDLPPSQARVLLEQFNQLNKRDFDAWVESFTNRISPMLSNRVIGSMVGQRDAPSFDFDRAIDEGAIVLVSLATERGKIAESDSRLFASLILSDLWQVAKLRGKKGAGYTKPFAIYADEFQSYLTPTMGQQLDQARGFGLQFILANQYPSQILDAGGDYGQSLYRSVMVNARTKVAFQSAEQPEERAALVAALFDGAIDVHRREEGITSFQVVGYKEVHRVLKGGSTASGTTTSTGTTTSAATGKGTTTARGSVTGEGEGSSESSSTGRSHNSGHASSFGQVDTFGSGTSTPELAGLDASFPSSVIETHGSGSSFGTSDISSDGESESEGSSTSTNRFSATNESVAEQVVTTTSMGESSSTSWSKTSANSWQEQITQEPILEERHTQLMSVENQVFAYGQQLAAQAPQHAHVRLPGQRLPDAFRALDTPEPEISLPFVERARTQIVMRTNCTVTFADAVARIARGSAPSLPDTDLALRAAAGRRRGWVATLKGEGDE